MKTKEDYLNELYRDIGFTLLKMTGVFLICVIIVNCTVR